MKLTRIKSVSPLRGFRLRLKLTDGRVVERDVRAYLTGPVFADVRNKPEVFLSVKVEHGTVVWPNGADLCPDLVIWGGSPPRDDVAAGSRGGRGRRRAGEVAPR